ncbi:MAG TPA: hypothetical protein PLV70_07065 [Flavobacteriales bacterium]|nr:hypothetical protein [Flavobacteriales bacterium]
MAYQAAGNWIRRTRLVTFPLLSTFTNHPSFTTSNSSTSSNALRLDQSLPAIPPAFSEARRKVLLVSGAFMAFRPGRVAEFFVAMR